MKVFTLSLPPLLFFAGLAQSVAAMTAVGAAHGVAVSAGGWRSIDRDCRYLPFSTGRSLVHLTYTCAGLGFRDSFGCFSRKKLLGRTETRTRDRMDCHSIQTV